MFINNIFLLIISNLAYPKLSYLLAQTNKTKKNELEIRKPNITNSHDAHRNEERRRKFHR